MKTKTNNYLKMKFPNLYNFKKWEFQEIGCMMLLVMFALIGLILALLV